MTPRQRLLATLRGQAVDRPALSFYELDGSQDQAQPDPFNIYADPSWSELLELTAARTDLIRRRGVRCAGGDDPLAGLSATRTWIDKAGSRHTERTLRAGDRVLRERTRRDPDLDTVWTIEHLIKDADDLAAWAALPVPADPGTPGTAAFLAEAAALGERGIMMVDSSDPLCDLAGLMAMQDFCLLCLDQPALVERALERAAAALLPRVRAAAAALPGRLWRIYGPEYAAPPYLPPRLYRTLVLRHDRALVQAIQAHGGWARIHSHGRLRTVLPLIAELGADGLDPIEPPPQGDLELSEVRAAVGGGMVLFGNLEIADLENLPTAEVRERTRRALAEGTAGHGRGFVLMPSASPYGRRLSPLTVANYRAVAEERERFAG
jgi:hypothetical protein